jgi:hypothetical protein
MTMLAAGNALTKEALVAAIQELAERLERRPTLPEVCSEFNVTARQIRKLFRSYKEAVRASGLSPLFRGPLKAEEILDDWRTVVRKLGRIPQAREYAVEGRHTSQTLVDRFDGWRNVAEGMLALGDSSQMWSGWEDVRDLVQRHVERTNKSTPALWPALPAIAVDAQMVYGEPLTESPMATAPTNELGVVLLFGTLARQLGFVVLKMQAQFPDCEALRRLDDHRWHRVRIEFEFESRNFVDHGHDPEGCDLIVCWKHTWDECAILVLELSKVVKNGASSPGAGQ